MSKPVILVVDDEQEIRSALKLLFHEDGYQVLAAASGAEALALLADAPACVAIVDQRMPGMSGTELLKELRARWPDMMRIMLTGYSDMSVAVSAVNEGAIFHYVAKPWDDQGMRVLMRGAVEHHQLEEENKRLQRVLQAQNAELKTWSQELELRVAARTAEIVAKNQQLEDTFVKIVEMLQSFIDMRGADAKGHGQRVSRAARWMATALELDAHAVRQIEIAAMLHDLGKLGLPEKVLEQDRARMSRDDFAVFARYPVLGYVTLRAIDELSEVAVLVRHHREALNGTGFPDRLRGESIPLGSRTIQVADEFDEKRNRHALERDSGILHDSRVVQTLFRYLDSPEAERMASGSSLSTLIEPMTLSPMNSGAHISERRLVPMST